MDEDSNENDSSIAHIKQLEHERNELRKDIEQLCMQQAGSSYLAVATRMHFQRTAGLEQEIENLKKRLASCMREKSNLQEELSEAYCIKGQLADLHAAEVSKNMEAEKQVKFFQGWVAAAFAERDHSIMEAEKAKEKEEVMSQKLSDFQRRLEELASDFLKERKLNASLEVNLKERTEQNDIFRTVVNKFYEIRQDSVRGFEDSWESKCECLLHDSAESWAFNPDGETSSSKYVSVLEEEVEMLRKSVDNLQNKLSLGLEIENHLKKRVNELKKKKTLLEETIKRRISKLLHYHSLQKAVIMDLLDEGYSHLKSIINMVEEQMRQLDASRVLNLESFSRDVRLDESVCRDLHVNTVAVPSSINEEISPKSSAVSVASGDISEALTQALQEKVAALLLLSQQEERHLLERNVNAALQRKVEELQRNLLQVTNEKVKSLMELAQLRRAYQFLQKKDDPEMKQGKLLAEIGERKILQERDGRLKNLLKKTYLRHWMGTLDSCGDAGGSNYSMDVVGMQIENATLKESLESMKHLISSAHRLRVSLLKVKESVTSEGALAGMSADLDNIIREARLVKTALGSSLPISWSAEADAGSVGESPDQESLDGTGGSSTGKVDFVSATGFEMVEILILAAEVLKDHIAIRDSREGR